MIEEGFYWVRTKVEGLGVQVAHRWENKWWLVGAIRPFPDSDIEVVAKVDPPVNASN